LASNKYFNYLYRDYKIKRNGGEPHIHAKIRANDKSPILAAQFFIPGLASNKGDFLYRDDLLIEMKDTPHGKVATFNFKLNS
jgi:hypothetical protein